MYKNYNERLLYSYIGKPGADLNHFFCGGLARRAARMHIDRVSAAPYVEGIKE
jgi:hypothetical protein